MVPSVSDPPLAQTVRCSRALSNSGPGSRIFTHREAANSKAVEKLLLPRIIPSRHIVVRRQIKYDAIDSVRHAGLKPSIRSLPRKHARTRCLEIIVFKNCLENIAASVDIRAHASRSPPIVFRDHDRSTSFKFRVQPQVIERTAFHQKAHTGSVSRRSRSSAASRASTVNSARDMNQKGPINRSASVPLSRGLPCLSRSKQRTAARAALDWAAPCAARLRQWAAL